MLSFNRSAQTWLCVFKFSLLIVHLCLPLQASSAHRSAQDKPMEREDCHTCHQVESQKWTNSHHHRAMAPVSPEVVLGDFSDVVVEEQSSKARFFTEKGQYFCETEGKDGKTKVFRISHVFGWTPLQQYLVQDDDGLALVNMPKTQVLAWTWDDEKKQWYHIYRHDMPVPGEPLHWTGWGQNWNHMCADCHVTAYDKNFDVKTQTFASNFKLDHVSCSACHAKDDCKKNETSSADASKSGVKDKGSKSWQGLLSFDKEQQKREMETCTPCHSFREQVATGFRPGHALGDHYGVFSLGEDTYHHDGQIKEEVYVVGSFKQSKMYRLGVRCSHCHDPHSLELRLPQEQVCHQCHAPETYAKKSHHFHKEGGPGSNCLECHMPESTYMGIDRRRDHSMRVPRPDLSNTLGSPNACTGCHLEEGKERQIGNYQDLLKQAAAGDASWKSKLEALNDKMSEAFERWYGKDQPEHYGEVFKKARDGRLSNLKPVTKIASDAMEYGPITRATALAILSQFAYQASPQELKRWGADADPMVRTASSQLIMDKPTMVKMLKDERAVVRINALRSYLQHRCGEPQVDRDLIRPLEQDIEAYLRVNGDQSGAHQLQSQFLYAMGDREGTKSALRLSIQIQPELAGSRASLAQLLEEDGKRSEALALRREELKLLQRDVDLAPHRSDLWYRLGLLAYGVGDAELTLTAMSKVLSLDERHYNAGAFVIQLLQRKGQHAKARFYAGLLLKHYPQDPWLRQVSSQR